MRTRSARARSLIGQAYSSAPTDPAGAQLQLVQLSGAQHLVQHNVLGVLAQTADRCGRSDGPPLQQAQGGPQHRIERDGTRKCDEPARRHRFSRHGGPDAAFVGQIEQDRGGQQPSHPGALESRLRRRIVEQQQKQVFGDPRHEREL